MKRKLIWTRMAGWLVKNGANDYLAILYQKICPKIKFLKEFFKSWFTNRQQHLNYVLPRYSSLEFHSYRFCYIFYGKDFFRHWEPGSNQIYLVMFQACRKQGGASQRMWKRFRNKPVNQLWKSGRLRRMYLLLCLNF